MTFTKRDDIVAATVCAVIGIMLSTLPHLLWWPKLGGPIWIADNDDLLYLAFGSQAYHNHPMHLGDPVRVTGGISKYPWVQFVPGIVIAKALALGPLGINLVWRIWAGLSIPLSWYLVIRHYVKRPLVASAMTVFLMADIGLLTSHLLVKQMAVFSQLVAGQPGALFETNPQIHVQWRIISPALSLAFLLIYLWFLARARTRPTWSRITWSGLAFGLLFYAYFYFWTAAGLGLLLAMVLDAGHRRVYFHTSWIGGFIGVPSLASGVLLKQSTSSEWLLRHDLFLPISRFSELLIPKLALVLLVVGLVWVWFRRKDLIYLWALSASGLALANHQILTGLQLENFHWVYVWGPSLSLLFVLLIAEVVCDRAPWPRLSVWALVAVCSLHLTAGVWMRAMEATKTRQPIEILANYRRYRDQRFGPQATGLAPNAVVAGEKGFVDLAVILENQRPLDHHSVVFSPSVDNAEWDARIALNGYLRGLNRLAFEGEQRAVLEAGVWGPWARDPVRRAEQLVNRIASYDAILADPSAALKRFGVRYVALPTGQTSPAYLNTSWSRLEAGPSWQVWERTNNPVDPTVE